MMKTKIALGVLLFVAGCSGCASSSSYKSEKFSQDIIDGASLEEITQSIQSALLSDNLAVRIYYRGECEVSDKPLPRIPLPQLSISQVPSGTTDVTRIRSIFLGNESVNVTRDNGGIIRIRINNPSDKILLTIIAELVFTLDEQYSGRAALKVIERAPEVLKAAERLNLSQTVPSPFGIMAEPNDQLPRLPPKVNDLTMDQAIDLVAKTFRSTIAYGHCQNQYMLKDLGRSYQQ